jgi:hypothetical protein
MSYDRGHYSRADLERSGAATAEPVFCLSLLSLPEIGILARVVQSWRASNCSPSAGTSPMAVPMY